MPHEVLTGMVRPVRHSRPCHQAPGNFTIAREETAGLPHGLQEREERTDPMDGTLLSIPHTP